MEAEPAAVHEPSSVLPLFHFPSFFFFFFPTARPLCGILLGGAGAVLSRAGLCRAGAVAKGPAGAMPAPAPRRWARSAAARGGPGEPGGAGPGPGCSPTAGDGGGRRSPGLFMLLLLGRGKQLPGRESGWGGGGHCSREEKGGEVGCRVGVSTHPRGICSLALCPDGPPGLPVVRWGPYRVPPGMGAPERLLGTRL